MFKYKLASQEGCYDKRLMIYYNSSELYQLHWFPFVKAYKVREVSKQKCLPSYYTHDEVVKFSKPNAKGEIPFNLQDP